MNKISKHLPLVSGLLVFIAGIGLFYSVFYHESSLVFSIAIFFAGLGFLGCGVNNLTAFKKADKQGHILNRLVIGLSVVMILTSLGRIIVLLTG